MPTLHDITAKYERVARKQPAATFKYKGIPFIYIKKDKGWSSENVISDSELAGVCKKLGCKKPRKMKKGGASTFKIGDEEFLIFYSRTEKGWIIDSSNELPSTWRP